MRNSLNAVLLLTFFAGSGAVAHAEERWWGGYPPQRVNELIRRVHADLDRGYHSGWTFGRHDRARLDRAEHELHEFAEAWHEGRFRTGELNESIVSIRRVVNDNHMSGRERDDLWRDLDALRRMREAYERHEIGRW